MRSPSKSDKVVAKKPAKAISRYGKKKTEPTTPKKKQKDINREIDKILEKESYPVEYPVQVSSPVNCVSTGLYCLDLILSGGYRKGRMYTHLGGPSAGKSSLVQTAIAAAQRAGIMIFYFDMESSAEALYMKKHGIVPQDEYKLPDGVKGFRYLSPENGEDMYRLAIKFMRMLPEDTSPNDVPRVIFLCDGYESMTSKGVNEDKNPIGAYARMHSVYQKLIRRWLRKTGAIWVATNQFRTTGIGSFFVNAEDDAGGWALKFYSDAKTKIRRSKPGSSGLPDNICKFTIETTRNRMAAPYKKIELRFIMNRGVDKLYDRLVFLWITGKVKRDEGKWIVEGKKYTAEKARLLMKEPEWAKLCAKLIKDPKTYETFFSEETRAEWVA